MRRGLLAAILLALAGCGGPQAGDFCVDGIAPVCASSADVLVCEAGHLRDVPCRGSSGCMEQDLRATCDMASAHAGDACPTVAEGAGLCDTANPDQVLRCTSGTWAAQPCHACTGGGNPVCAQ